MIFKFIPPHANLIQDRIYLASCILTKLLVYQGKALNVPIAP